MAVDQMAARASVAAGSTTVILRVAANQGLVTRQQVLKAGLSPDAMYRQVRTGLLRRRHAGVYQVGPVAAPNTRERAASLACRGGIISYMSALALWQFAPAQRRGEPVDVTTRSRCGRRPGIRAHRDDLADEEITVLHGIPVTSIARTLLDVSTILTGRALEQAIAGAERADPKTVERVTALLDRYPGRTGTPALRRMLLDARSFTRSVLEETALRLMLEAGFPKPLVNVVRYGFELDLLWPDAGVGIELDGREYHRTREDFERDHRRDSALAARGIHVIRISWTQITKSPIRTIAEIAQALTRARLKS